MRHEVNTVFAADAVSRLTDTVGVACVTAGPGLTNTVTAVKNARMAHSPVVLLGGATVGLLKNRGSLQVRDVESALCLPQTLPACVRACAVGFTCRFAHNAFREFITRYDRTLISKHCSLRS